MNHTDSARVQDGQCTCPWLHHRYAERDTIPDPDCPRHGLEAILERADRELDIDTSYQREERKS